MNEKLIFETLYWLVSVTEVPQSRLDSQVVFLNKLGEEIVKLTPQENDLEKRRVACLEGSGKE